MAQQLRRNVQRSIGLVVACALAACAPKAPSMQIILPSRQFTVDSLKLPSGLQVIVEEDPTARGVASALAINAGAADDPAELGGIAHFVEHLNFRAHAEGQAPLSTRLALAGVGIWNAETTLDSTTYYEVGAPETLPAIIEMELARIVDPLQGVTEQQLALERGVVLGEIGFRDETGQLAEVRRTLLGQLFSPTHPYARGVGGTPESVARITLDAARSWTREHYRPWGMTWVLVGSVKTEDVLKMLEKTLPPSLREPTRDIVGRAGRPLPAPGPVPETTPVVRAPLDHPEVIAAWALPPATDKFEPAYATVAGMVSGRASKVDGVAGTDVHFHRLDAATVIEVHLHLVDSADPKRVIQDLGSKLADTFTVNVPSRYATAVGIILEKAFVQARTAALVALARASDSIASRALTRAKRANSSHSTQSIQSMNDALLGVSFGHVLAAGQQYVTAAAMRAVIVKPVPGEFRRDEAAAPREVPAAFAAPAEQRDVSVEDVTRLIHGPGLSGVTSFRASNGLEVVAVPRPKTGLVTLTLAFPGGRRTSAPPGLADRLSWSEQSWDYGSPPLIGAEVSSWWSDDAGFIQYQGSSGNVSTLLAMLSERVVSRHAVDPPKAVVAAKAVESEQARFDRSFWRALYGNDGRPRRPTDSELIVVPAKTAQSWLERQLDPRRSVLVITGDVGPSVKDEVEHWLARWKRSDEPSKETLPALPAAPGVLRLLKAPVSGTNQVRVHFACTARSASKDGVLALWLLGSDVERQWDALEREALGTSYGFVRSVAVNRDGTMRLEVEGRVDHSGLKQMASAVGKSWLSLPEAGTTPARLNRLRWDFARQFDVRYLTSNALGRGVAEERIRGESFVSLDEVPTALLRLGPGELADIGTQCQRSGLVGFAGNLGTVPVESLLPPGTQVLSP